MRSRKFLFTLNNYTDDEVNALKSIKCTYIIFGYEVAPSTGTPHLQCFIVFANAKTLSAAIKSLPRRCSNVQIADGTALSNKKYCTKTRDVDPVPNERFYEAGTMPKTPKQKGEITACKYSEALDHIKNNKIELVDPSILVRCYRNLRQIQTDLFNTAPRDRSSCTGIWLVGETGAGKSHMARSVVEKLTGRRPYDKMLNKWWDGYMDGDVALMDDLSPDHGCLINHLKRWADKYSYTAETKGGVRTFRPPVLIVTSQYTPIGIFEREADVSALARRFKIIQVTLENRMFAAQKLHTTIEPLLLDMLCVDV